LLVPFGEALLGRIGFDEWLRRSQAAAIGAGPYFAAFPPGITNSTTTL
jgi:hypothetical protein